MIPAFVERAFSAVRVIGFDEEDVQTFAARWGGLDLSALTRALQQGSPQDQQVAAFAIGSFHSRWARDLLLPFLQHDDPPVRWAVVLELGEMREESVLPVLLQMLREFLPPHATSVQNDWYDIRHLDVARLMGAWGKEEAIPALQSTLTELWTAEQQAHEDIQLWWRYQDRLVYALGQLGAFEALAPLALPRARALLWTVELVMGYLNTEAFARKSVSDMLLDVPEPDVAALLAPVPDLLQQRMGWPAQEAANFADVYQKAYLNRWEQENRV